MYINTLASASWRRISAIYHTSCINYIPDLSNKGQMFVVTVINNGFQHTMTSEHQVDKIRITTWKVYKKKFYNISHLFYKLYSRFQQQRADVHCYCRFNNAFHQIATNGHYLDKNNNLRGLSKLQETNLTNNMQK